MIEATCTACGTVNRIADADVPVGAKFVNCASCKSRVAIPMKPAGPGEALDLADLPAPRRASPLGSEPVRPAPRSALANAAMEPELPAPRSKGPSVSVPASSAGPLDLDDILADAGAELPAPRPAGQRSASDLPAPKSKVENQRPVVARAMTDLPVPGVADTAPLADLPSPKPKGMPALADLPAPKPKGVPPIPKPAAAPEVTDLPSPKPRGVPALGDLPAPKPRGVPAIPPAAAKPAGVVDLPSPKAGGIVDLPTPKPGGVTDLPMPKPGQAGDLPAPLGFFDDLPQPAQPGAQTNEVAPKGFFDDLPGRPTQQKPEVPAPKGFFDDLPGRPAQQKPEVPAPKGFFDDLPRPASPGAQANEVAPKGFFDDLPGRPAQQKPEGFFDDLPKPGSSASQPELQLDALDLEPEPSNPGIELDALELAESASPPPAQPRFKPPSIAPAPGPSSQFDDLDLSAPSPVSFAKGGASGARPAGAGVATINPAAAAAAAASAVPKARPGAFGPAPNKGADVALELEEPRPTVPSAKLGAKPRTDERKAKAAASKEQSARRRKIAGIALVGVLALGGGGFYAYRHFATKADAQAAIDERLAAARKAITGSRWAQASAAANKTLELDKRNGEALAIRAEALFALGLAEGGNPGRFGQARKSVTDAIEAGASPAALERAQALSPLAASQPDKAIPKLQALVAKAPKDAGLQLYLGWAQAAHGDLDAAITAFDAAIASPAVKVPALFARGLAKQAKGDLEAARADYAAVLEAQKDHVGAQIGLASSLPASQAQQQEADLLAILALKDVEKREPRASMQAWILAAELARKGGRLDVARERYRKALAIQATDVAALTGLAEVELADDKPEVAAELLAKAPPNDDLRAALVGIEIAIAKKQLDDAGQRLEALAKRTPPPPVLARARIAGLAARLAEAQGKEQDAIDAYLEAARLAGEQDLTPTLVAVSKLTALADQATAANDLARASELRRKSDQLLSELSDAALQDPTLALTLGMAYLQAGDPVKAETWLRKAIELSPKNVDAMYQLAKALTKQGKDAEAIGNLRNAVELDPTRSEIGMELARTYETASPPRVVDAEKLYDKLLAAKEPSLELRARAGRFYARVGLMEKAGEQGVEILKVQDDHPAGLYLKGEGLLAGAKTDAARKLFVLASDTDPEPQYLDARGRADEQWAKESGNTSYQDDALRSYAKAVERDATWWSAWVGLGRLYVLRSEDAKALEPLQKAWGLRQSAEVARLLGIALKNIGNQPQNAAGWLEKSWDLEPHADTAYNLGILYTDERVNHPQKAIAALERATRLALQDEKDAKPTPPWLTEALYQLGDIHRTQNNLRGAKQAWEKWLQRNPPQTARWKEVKQMMVTSLKDL